VSRSISSPSTEHGPAIITTSSRDLDAAHVDYVVDRPELAAGQLEGFVIGMIS